MTPIRSLGYIGLSVSDINAWKRFASDFIGLEWSDAATDGVHHLRQDHRKSRIQLHDGVTDDLAYVGWEVAHAGDLAELQERLAQANIATEALDQDTIESRMIEDGIRFVDGDGLSHEAFYGAVMSYETPFRPGRPITGFETDLGGLGHIVLNVKNVAVSRAFYENVLGFQVSDFIRFSPFPGFDVDLTFLRCNSRHHTIALATFPFPKRMQHLMLQYSSLDDVGRAYDMANSENMPVSMTLGRHSNDHMVSFYLRSPSGFDVELGWGAIDIDGKDWTVQIHHSQSVWGHKPGPGMPPPPDASQ